MAGCFLTGVAEDGFTGDRIVGAVIVVRGIGGGASSSTTAVGGAIGGESNVEILAVSAGSDVRIVCAKSFREGESLGILLVEGGKEGSKK